MISRNLCLLVGGILIICALETAAYRMFGAAAPQEASRPFLTVEEARRYLAEHADTLIVDLRSRSEFEAGHTPDAVNIPLYAISDMASGLPADKPVLLVDLASLRAYQAYWTLRRLRPDIAELHYVQGWLWGNGAGEKKR